MASSDLFDLCDQYLDACVAALADTPEGPPDRYFVSPGVPSWDCPEQLTVHVGAPLVADTFPLQPSLAPAHRVTVQGQVDMIQLTATILRCAPTLGDDGTLPTPAQIDAASQQTLADLWAIWNYVKTAKRQNVLFPPKEREFQLDPAVSLNQTGGVCGWQVPIRVQLNGYVATL